VLPAEQLARINQALLDIVEDLESVDDSRHFPPEGPGSEGAGSANGAANGGLREAARGEHHPVLCVPGRGAFDDVVAAIVSQLLARRGVPCVTTSYEQVRSTRAGMVDPDLTPVICVVSLDTPEAPPYLRNLVRRLRERSAHARILVGVGTLRREEGPVVIDDPDAHLVATLRDLVEDCAAGQVGEDRQARTS
jgi:hypothetical protein